MNCCKEGVIPIDSIPVIIFIGKPGLRDREIPLIKGAALCAVHVSRIFSLTAMAKRTQVDFVYIRSVLQRCAVCSTINSRTIAVHVFSVAVGVFSNFSLWLLLTNAVHYAVTDCNI